MMESDNVFIPRPNHANPAVIILMYDNPWHLLRATRELFKTFVKRSVASEGHQADEQKIAVSPTEGWASSMEKMAYIQMDTDTSKAVNETEEHALKEPVGD